jgi:tetratricopeptide (TPR) repeat protein
MAAMKKTSTIGLLFLMMLTFWMLPRVCGAAESQLTAARQARDRANLGALRKMIRQTRDTSGGVDEAKLALLEKWLCEAAYAHKDERAVKQAADAGVRAAERAVTEDSHSARAHWLLGALLGQKIPYAFLGGLRYGPRSIRELRTAMKLDPSNANAFISRAIAYYMTSRLFGGDKDKAVALLKMAVRLNPAPDSADTAYIWLALAYDAQGKKARAVREIERARHLNPDRQFSKQTYDRIMAHH